MVHERPVHARHRIRQVLYRYRLRSAPDASAGQHHLVHPIARCTGKVQAYQELPVLVAEAISPSADPLTRWSRDCSVGHVNRSASLKQPGRELAPIAVPQKNARHSALHDGLGVEQPLEIRNAGDQERRPALDNPAFLARLRGLYHSTGHRTKSRK
jgi:hypothetical protein